MLQAGVAIVKDYPLMGVGPDQIRQLVSSLAAATLDMANHNRHLNEQLQRSSQEIDTLL